MNTYVIGDIQGCNTCLQNLLKELQFDPTKDKLLFVGDLINRGPESLAVLRFVMSLGDRADSVLGNHDLHLLAVYYGNKTAGKKDTFKDVLDATDVKDIMRWLRARPLMISHAESQSVITHAGLHPQWNYKTAKHEAHYVESLIQGKNHVDFFQNMYGNNPKTWKPGRRGYERSRFALNCFTRMRYIDSNGQLDFKEKGPLGSQPKGYLPWFEVKKRNNTELKIIFGHWSTLNNPKVKNIYPTDSGCVWGGKLSAFKLEDSQYHHYQCPSYQDIKKSL